MKRTFLLFALLASLCVNMAACSDDDTEEPSEHGEQEHEDGGADHAYGGLSRAYVESRRVVTRVTMLRSLSLIGEQDVARDSLKLSCTR